MCRFYLTVWLLLSLPVVYAGGWEVVQKKSGAFDKIERRNEPVENMTGMYQELLAKGVQPIAVLKITGNVKLKISMTGKVKGVLCLVHQGGKKTGEQEIKPPGGELTAKAGTELHFGMVQLSESKTRLVNNRMLQDVTFFGTKWTATISYKDGPKPLLDGQGQPDPGTSAAADRVALLRVNVKPSSVPVDGKSQSTVSIVAYTMVEGDDASRQPLKGQAVTLALVPQDGVTPGKLNRTQLTLDADGHGEAVFTAPTPAALKGKRIQNAEVRARCPKFGLKDDVRITLEQGSSQVNVLPHYGDALMNSKVGVIPADKRFPATVHFFLRDERDKPIKDETVTFALKGAPGYLEGLAPGKGGTGKAVSKGATVKVKTDAEGDAYVRYVYTGPATLRGPKVAAIRITSKRLPAPVTAAVSIGIDLAVASVMPAYKGKVNAGEEARLAVQIVDTFHPRARNISNVLSHWLEDDATGQQMLLVDLDIRPGANVPEYLTDFLNVNLKLKPVKTLAKARYDKNRGTTILISFQDDAVNYPRIKVATSGLNTFELSAYLATVVPGAKRKVERLTEPRMKNNWGYIQIPAGVRADANYEFFVKGPFSANSKQAEALRSVAGLNGFGGSVLWLNDSINAINRGNWEDPTDITVQRVIDKWGDQYKINSSSTLKALTTSAAKGYSEVIGVASMVEAVSAYGKDELDKQAPQLLQGAAQGGDKGMAKVSRRLTLKESIETYQKAPTKLVLVLAEKAHSLVDTKTGKSLTGPPGRLHRLEQGASICRKDFSVYVLPADMEVKAENATKVIEHKPETVAPRLSVTEPGCGPAFRSDAAKQARSSFDDALHRARAAYRSKRLAEVREALRAIDKKLTDGVSNADELRRQRRRLSDERTSLELGRGVAYPALEGGAE